MEGRMGKKLPADKLIGESWELSGLEGNLSVVSNGPLKGNNIEELIEVYMGDLVGDHIYNKFGLQFPLIFKIIDANDNLSVQVHPDDRLAAERHGSWGKTEMWVVIDCEPGAELSVGFNRAVSRAEYETLVREGRLADVLNRIRVKPGEAYFIPAGVVHAIGKGVMVAEIQQASDITYRIFDWNRTDDSGKSRQLHTELAVDAIRFDCNETYNVTFQPVPNRKVNLKSCPYFNTGLIDLDGSLSEDHGDKDSFVVYMILEGEVTFAWKERDSLREEKARRGETVLLPACIDNVTLAGRARLLECYMD